MVYVPEEYHSGGAYTAIQAAADGRVYLGTTMYDGYAHLLLFVPGTGRFESLAEMSAATGERTPGPYAQAKIHTKPAIAPDGRVYFGTKSGKPAADARWQQNYPGGHLLVYDPRSNATTDLGIIKPRVSIIAVGVDPSRGVVYALTDPESRLVTYDPRARSFTDRGQFGPPGTDPTRYLVVLANGDAFHRLGDAAMARYTAASGTIERLPLVISGGGTYEPPYALAPLPDGRRFVGVGDRSGQVYVFEPREREIAVRNLGSVSGEVQTSKHYAIAAASDGAVFYPGVAGGQEVFVFRVGPDLTAPRVIGRVAPLGPPPAGYSRTVARRLIVEGATITPDGTLIVMTAYPLRLLLFRGLAAR
jgi:outer membrane protein assembly factor BamB